MMRSGIRDETGEDLELPIGFWRRNRIDCALVLLVLAVFGPLVAANNAQPASRIDLTAALVEHHTIDITGYPRGVDYARYQGRPRSDKGPGQPLLAVPFYAAERVVGAESASQLRQNRDLTLWWVTLWTATIPFAALLVMIRRTSARFVALGSALVITLGLGFGTVMTPYAANLYGHILAATFAFGAWLALERARESHLRLALAGLLAGAAVLVEYQVVIIAAVLLAAAFALQRGRAWWFALGALPPAFVLAFYQWRAFGAPWRTPYAYFAGSGNGAPEVGYAFPTLHSVAAELTGGRGLLLLSPLALVGVVAAMVAARSASKEVRMHAWIAVAVSASYILLVVTWKGTRSLEVPGPRYLIPMVPFFAVPLSVVWGRWKAAIVTTAVWGAVVQLVATFSGVLIGQNEPIVHAYRLRLSGHHFLPTTWSISMGDAGVVMYLLTVALAMWFVISSERKQLAT
jgi:hypothetical protein